MWAYIKIIKPKIYQSIITLKIRFKKTLIITTVLIHASNKTGSGSSIGKVGGLGGKNWFS